MEATLNARLRLAIISLFLISILSALPAQTAEHGAAQNRIQLKLNTEEADAVLTILDKHSAGTAITDGDWHLFATEPYTRLKQREAGMKRAFTDDDFKAFVLSTVAVEKVRNLHRSVAAWCGRAELFSGF
jgi:hypothetical protein